MQDIFLRISQILGNFAKINPKELRILCIREIESFENFFFLAIGENKSFNFFPQKVKNFRIWHQVQFMNNMPYEQRKLNFCNNFNICVVFSHETIMFVL